MACYLKIFLWLHAALHKNNNEADVGLLSLLKCSHKKEKHKNAHKPDILRYSHW